jgi:FkbH-like protein
MPAHLHWLPEPPPQWTENLAAAKNEAAGPGQWELLIRLANYRLDFVQTGRLDRTLRKLSGAVSEIPGTKSLRVALLGSSTVTHLVPGIRVGALRRGIRATVYEGGYGQYRQELTDHSSGLHQFRPNVVLFALDARHLLGSEEATVDRAAENLAACWQLARESFGCTVIQQTILPVLSPFLGNNEHRLPDSPHWKIQELNFRLRGLAAASGVHLLAIDKYAELDGVKEWHDPAFWNRAKQEVHVRVSHIYGDLVGRLLAAEQGRSYKCLALDLDNTLWGGVIGDDGIGGILLGQGHAVGEAYVDFQRYIKELARRGVILAVCSKNDEVNARQPFKEHPEMVIREADVACFVANWDDKASNLRRIAATLNIGLDSIVFVDDNPFERNLVRAELPMVAVPELPEDPSFYASCLSQTGYFEALHITDEDHDRVRQYRENAERDQLRQNTTDMAGYLTSLNMELFWKPFDPVSLSRVVQLINKTNQFNLTTRRYSAADVTGLMADSNVMTLHFRLTDRFGDNGIIAIVIGKLTSELDLLIDTWLMSCRVLGRQVEETTLDVLAAAARIRGARTLTGEYLPTAKNGMVKDHYRKLGFTLVSEKEDGSSLWALDLATYEERASAVRVLQA